MLGFFTLLFFVLASYFILRLLKSNHLFEKILFIFGISISLIVLSGYILSLLNHIGDIFYWAIFGFLIMLISYFIFVSQNKSEKRFFQNFSIAIFLRKIQSFFLLISDEIKQFNPIIIFLFITVIITNLINLFVVFFTAPNTWDSLAVHLARMAYYIQNNNLNYYPANHWAQVIHPKIQSVLLIFTYLVTNRSENLTQIVQYVCYWVSIVAVYSIAMRCGKSKNQSMFAALVSGLLIEWLMEATTVQNDMIVTAFIGLSTFAFLSFRKTKEIKYLFFAGLGICLSIGTKEAAIIPIITLGIIALFSITERQVKSTIRNLAIFLAFCLVTFLLFVLPSGYLEVNRIFGDAYVSGFSFIGKPIGYIAENGIKNVFRFLFDSFSFDGIPAIPFVNKIQASIRYPFFLFVKRILGLKLNTSIASAIPFSFDHDPRVNEDSSWFGVFGFAFLWIGVFISVVFPKKSREEKVLAFSAIIFLLLQAFYGPYDPFRGRYFCSWAIFSAPLTAVFYQPKHFWKQIYVYFIVLLGCISSIFGVFLKWDKPILLIDQNNPCIFSEDRIHQLSKNCPSKVEPLTMFESLVPEDAVVAVFFMPDTYEYPLFGKKLTRTILPINSIKDGMQPIPENASFLLYTDIGYPCPLADDISLGSSWYLRRLTDENRECKTEKINL